MRFMLVLLVSFLASPAYSFEAHFEVDPWIQAQLPQLAKTHNPTTHSAREGNLYTADASAVLHVDAAQLFSASMDYDHYVEFGMPHLNESHTVEQDGDDLLYVFSSLSVATLTSRHYLEVRVHRSLDFPGAQGLEWQLVHKRAGWLYREDPKFSRMDGSFYLQPLADGNVYVRYFLANHVDIPLSGLFSGFIQHMLRGGASDVIMVLARQANLRP